MSFYKWLELKHRTESNQFGKLVDLMKNDTEAPRHSTDEREIRNYLIRKRVSLKMMRAFNKAFMDYGKKNYDA